MKRLLPLLGIVTALACLPALGLTSSELPLNAFVLADNEQAAAQAIRAAGGQACHIFPHAILGYLPSNVSLVGVGTVREVARGPVDVGKLAAYGLATQAAAGAWNENVCGLVPASARATREIMAARRLVGDILDLPRRSPYLEPALQKLLPTGAGRYNTSEYLVGSVAVGIIVPESSGSGENWSADRLSRVVSETQAGIEWWRRRDTSAMLSFTYDVHLSVPVSVEPITMPAVGDATSIEEAPMGQWIGECYAYLGYPATTMYEENAYSYANDLRQTKRTHWAFTVFIVDSLNDADGCFADGLFAFARPGGPYLVMTYDNDGWGIENMDSTVAHEMGHIFYALDEYPGPFTVNDRSGYYNEINGNNEEDGITNDPCIMRGDTEAYVAGAVCPYSRRQVGQRDQNGNGIQDVIDNPPVCTLNPYPQDPTGRLNLSYLGQAVVGTLPNLNPMRPELPHPAISISTIAAVQWQLDGGQWIDAQPVSGTFDSGSETFQFTAQVTVGQHTISARAVDSQGKTAVSAADQVLVISVPRVVSCTPLPGSTEVSRRTVLTVTFSEPIVASSISPDNFRLRGQGSGPVTGTVSYDALTRTATFTPANRLEMDTYTASVEITPTAPVSPDGRQMAERFSWTFVVPEDIFPPVITMITPQAGATVRGLVPIRAQVEDETSVARVDTFIDGVNIAIQLLPPYETSWETRVPWVSDGPHDIMIWAWDGGGRLGMLTTQVIVHNAVFDDVPKGSALCPYAEALYRERITMGCSTVPPLYCPNRAVTRAEMAAFLCRAAGIAPYLNPNPTFADVPSTSPIYGYVEALVRAGIAGGCSTAPRLFCPSAPVTRGQMAVMLCRAAGIAPYYNPTPTFADVPASSGQYPYIEALYRATITGGIATAPLRYGPSLAITRGQMAVFLCRGFNIALQ